MVKIFTDIDQSKKLAKILPLDSADMYLQADNKSSENYTPDYNKSVAVTDNLFSFRNGYTVPCWSLSALFGLLPNGSAICKSDDGKYFFYKGGIQYDNPVDACVDFLIHGRTDVCGDIEQN